ncbi:MAG: hypothetical protein LH479_04155 [Polaromonas sp.]|nr:hypothetical protein [Polaromonas sp.]
MFSIIQGTQGQSAKRRGLARHSAAIALIAASLLLGACGGGGNDGGSSGNINIGVTVGGRPGDDFIVAPGSSVGLAVRAGESVILEAGEPVFWTLLVGGAAVSPGVEVFYAGVNIRATTLDSFAVALDTFARFPLASPVPVTLVGTSTFDSAQVATVNILITN